MAIEGIMIMRHGLGIGFASIFALSLAVVNAAADGKPCPSGAICENFVATYSRAHFSFDIPDYQHAIEVDVTAVPPARGVPLKLKTITITYGDKSVKLDDRDVAAIEQPNMSYLNASALIPFNSKKPLIVLSIFDGTEVCDGRYRKRGCGWIEFDWDLRDGSIKKNDSRPAKP
jgi:hypothetical protein